MTKPIAAAILITIVLAGCRPYDSYPHLSDQKGLIPADQWASYGQEEAQSIAIGRAFGEAFAGTTPEARARQMASAMASAESAGAVVETADTMGYRLEVRLASGWRRAILPIADGGR